MAIENTVSIAIFYQRSPIVESVFECCLSGVNLSHLMRNPSFIVVNKKGASAQSDLHISCSLY